MYFMIILLCVLDYLKLFSKSDLIQKYNSYKPIHVFLKTIQVRLYFSSVRRTVEHLRESDCIINLSSFVMEAL